MCATLTHHHTLLAARSGRNWINQLTHTMAPDRPRNGVRFQNLATSESAHPPNSEPQLLAVNQVLRNIGAFLGAPSGKPAQGRRTLGAIQEG